MHDLSKAFMSLVMRHALFDATVAEVDFSRVFMGKEGEFRHNVGEYDGRLQYTIGRRSLRDYTDGALAFQTISPKPKAAVGSDDTLWSMNYMYSDGEPIVQFKVACLHDVLWGIRTFISFSHFSTLRYRMYDVRNTAIYRETEFQMARYANTKFPTYPLNTRGDPYQEMIAALNAESQLTAKENQHA